MPSRIRYPASVSFRREGERKAFPNKQKLKEFITTKPALQEILRGILLVKCCKDHKVLETLLQA